MLFVATVIPAAAHGEPRDEPPRERSRRDLCAPGVQHHGAAIDLDVQGADLPEVFRLIADAGRVNLVVPDEVTGKVTLHLRRVAWDAVACAVARLHHLAIAVDGNILVVTRDRAPAPGKR
jgi:type II secretory pathway component HofQ